MKTKKPDPITWAYSKATAALLLPLIIMGLELIRETAACITQNTISSQLTTCARLRDEYIAAIKTFNANVKNGDQEKVAAYKEKLKGKNRQLTDLTRSSVDGIQSICPGHYIIYSCPDNTATVVRGLQGDLLELANSRKELGPSEPKLKPSEKRRRGANLQ